MPPSQGIDAGKKIVGRKRNIVTDTIGLLLAVAVTAASVQDSVADTRLLDQVAAGHPGIRKVLMLHRRLACDYETPSARSEAMIHLAMTDLMARRLTGENTLSWRDTAKSHQPQIQG